MAKSDSFFIRAKVTLGSYDETEIDLGSFVNLGVSKSTLLRIRNIQVQYADDTGVAYPIYTTQATGAKVAWQLTTQSQADLITADDKSVVSSGSLTAYGNPNSTAHGISSTQDQDINVQHWTNGYLIGVDTLFLGGAGVGAMGGSDLSAYLVIEAQLENATQANSVALALSQQ